MSCENKTMTSNNNETEVTKRYVSPGMPPLAGSTKKPSFFEFWPTWLIYMPVFFNWLYLSVKHRSLTLPLIANPCLPLSGMVGVPKSELLAQAEDECADSVLDWFIHKISEQPSSQQANAIVNQMAEKNFQFPIVCKPDIGCRGYGVKLIGDLQQLEAYISAYPKDSSVMLQKLAKHEAEAGVFFVREPNQPSGKIISLALKYMPYVVGDGCRTLQQLINDDDTANQLAHLYLERHKNNLSSIIPKGQAYRLIFSASHCRGAIFKNAQNLITPELTDTINRICAGLPEFYYGRMDIKFRDVESLKLGQSIEIIEINTASSESLHIWDSGTRLSDAISALLFQYRTLFKIGHQNRARGYRAPGVVRFFKHWLTEMRLRKFYPETD